MMERTISSFVSFHIIFITSSHPLHVDLRMVHSTNMIATWKEKEEY